MARTKKSRGKAPFQMRSGNNSPYKFFGGGLAGMMMGMDRAKNTVTNMQAMKKAQQAAGDDFDHQAWMDENLEGGMMGTLKNQGEGGGIGGGIGGGSRLAAIGKAIKGTLAGRMAGGGGGRLAAIHDKLHGKDDANAPAAQPPLSKNKKYIK